MLVGRYIPTGWRLCFFQCLPITNSNPPDRTLFQVHTPNPFFPLRRPHPLAQSPAGKEKGKGKHGPSNGRNSVLRSRDPTPRIQPLETTSLWAPPYCSTGVAPLLRLLLRLLLRRGGPIAPPICPIAPLIRAHRGSIYPAIPGCSSWAESYLCSFVCFCMSADLYDRHSIQTF